VSDRFEGLLFAVWEELSRQCQDDLLMHSRPGAIIRCTARDMELLAPIPLSAGTVKHLLERLKVVVGVEDPDE